MKYLITIILLIFFCGCSFSFAQDNEIKGLISKYYPGKTQKNNDLFIKNAKDTFNADLEALTMITSDLNGNGLQDYAVILEGEIFVLFIQKSKGKFERHELLNAKWVGDYISEIKPKTKIIEFDSNKSLFFEYSVIELHYFMKSTVAYYWDKDLKRFEKIWTGD